MMQGHGVISESDDDGPVACDDACNDDVNNDGDAGGDVLIVTMRIIKVVKPRKQHM